MFLTNLIKVSFKESICLFIKNVIFHYQFFCVDNRMELFMIYYSVLGLYRTFKHKKHNNIEHRKIEHKKHLTDSTWITAFVSSRKDYKRIFPQFNMYVYSKIPFIYIKLFNAKYKGRNFSVNVAINVKARTGSGLWVSGWCKGRSALMLKITIFNLRYTGQWLHLV